MTNLTHLQRQITEAKFEDTSPLAHGWTFAYRHPDFGYPVFTQGDAKLMYRSDYGSWYFSIDDGEARPIKGTMKEMTKNILKELGK